MSSISSSYAQGKPVPEDILRMIIEEYMEDSSANDFNLITVSKVAFKRITPRLYHTVIPRTRGHARLFIESLHGQLQYCKPAPHVQHLWLHEVMSLRTELAQLLEVMDKCTNLRHIAYGPVRTSAWGHTVSNPPPSLSRLSFISMPFQRDTIVPNVSETLLNLRLPLSSLTHLHFLVPVQPVFDFLFQHAPDLTSLTHLVLDISLDDPNRPAPRLQSTLFLMMPKLTPLRHLFLRVPSLKEIVITSIHDLTTLEELLERTNSHYPDLPQFRIVSGASIAKDRSSERQSEQSESRPIGITPRLENVSHLWGFARQSRDSVLLGQQTHRS